MSATVTFSNRQPFPLYYPTSSITSIMMKTFQSTNIKQPPDKLHCYNWDKSKIATQGFIRQNIIKNNKVITPIDIINMIYAFYFGNNIVIDTRYYETNQLYYDQSIIVPMYSSLQNIWKCIQTQFDQISKEIINNITIPIFTLISRHSNSNQIIPEITDSTDYLFDKNYYAKMLYHGLNPLNLWGYHFNDNSLYTNDFILCFEMKSSSIITNAYCHWNIEYDRKTSLIEILDYTQTTDLETDNDIDYNINIHGSSLHPNIKMRRMIWIIARGTSLERFYEIARQRLNVPNDVDIRALRILDDERYLIPFPYLFMLRYHKVVLERGRYPKYDEVFLWTCIINEDNSITKFIPVIIEKKKSVKYLKQMILKTFKLNVNDYKKYVCYNINLGAGNNNRVWRESLTLQSETIHATNGDRVGLQIGEDIIYKKVILMKDVRDLSKLWDYTNSYTDTSMTLSDKGTNPYIQTELGTLSIRGDIDLKQLREQIYSMDQEIKHNVKSYKNILISWFDSIYQIPFSFPKLTSGPLESQKNFNHSRSVLCVEIMDEEIEEIPKHSRFLHIYLAKIQRINDKQDESMETTENKEDKDDNIWNKNNLSISYWPPDHHLRVLYFENGNDKMNKITYHELSKFICKKYYILYQNLLIVMFNVNKDEWILIDDSCDQNRNGLSGQPFNIKESARHGQIFCIFDLSQCIIPSVKDDDNNDKIEFIKQSIKYWTIPPLSLKAQFHYDHFNNKRSN